MRILFVGDVVGKIGRRMLREHLQSLKSKYHVQLCIVNGENAAHGKGITRSTYKELVKAGADVVTLGNHAYSKSEGAELLNEDVNMIRPINFPEGAPGRGYTHVNVNGKRLLVVNAQARSFMPAIDCPFKKIDSILTRESYDYSILDFHSETTSEALAMGYYVDGRMDAVVGTHTHVQTNDARVLDKRTLYITDVGMTGFSNGILGINKEQVIERFITGLPRKHVVPDNGRGMINAVFLDLDQKKIETIQVHD